MTDATSKTLKAFKLDIEEKRAHCEFLKDAFLLVHDEQIRIAIMARLHEATKELNAAISSYSEAFIKGSIGTDP